MFETPSVAVAVTVVVPTGNCEPDAGEATALTPGQLSLEVGAGKFTRAPVKLPPGTTTLAGQVIEGGCVSLTASVKVQDRAVGLDSEQVTVVVPVGEKLPLAGVQVTVPQGPSVVGAGYVGAAPHWLLSVGPL